MVKINPNSTSKFRCRIPKEITEEFLLESYEILKKDFPPLEISNDPKGFLKLSAAAFLMHYFFKNAGKEVTKTGIWYVDKSGDNREYVEISKDDQWTATKHWLGKVWHTPFNDWDSIDAPNYSKDKSPGHWRLIEGKTAGPLDYKIPYWKDSKWDYDVVGADLHLYYLDEAGLSDEYSSMDCERVDNWAAGITSMESSNEIVPKPTEANS